MLLKERSSELLELALPEGGSGLAHVRFGQPSNSSFSTVGPRRLSYRSSSTRPSSPASTSGSIGDVISFCRRQTDLRALYCERFRVDRMGVFKRRCCSWRSCRTCQLYLGLIAHSVRSRTSVSAEKLFKASVPSPSSPFSMSLSSSSSSSESEFGR